MSPQSPITAATAVTNTKDQLRISPLHSSMLATTANANSNTCFPNSMQHDLKYRLVGTSLANANSPWTRSVIALQLAFEELKRATEARLQKDRTGTPLHYRSYLQFFVGESEGDHRASPGTIGVS
ncbi:hypothetical protein I350_07592 [Cryptococcus amylolentus CBS 6273]|uniref:Uncharacterized protein n=1 Tax=Cryptococcus amylolentus CBS 6273 TaxID=1296118 RepID=A0A1E3JBB0_9TREE|nr:hypothetical protein I350_07592 [Cryptococcus amylolentus CBS 6273]